MGGMIEVGEHEVRRRSHGKVKAIASSQFHATHATPSAGVHIRPLVPASHLFQPPEARCAGATRHTMCRTFCVRSHPSPHPCVTPVPASLQPDALAPRQDRVPWVVVHRNLLAGSYDLGLGEQHMAHLGDR